MKKLKYILAMISAVIVGVFFAACDKTAPQINLNTGTHGSNDYTYTVPKGDIGEFALLTPEHNGTVTSVPKFTWEEAENADSYTLELSSSSTFTKETDTTVYVEKTGIRGTEFTFVAGLRQKECNYYWRVTATNGDSKKARTSEISSFYLAAGADSEIPFDLSDADEWKLHQEGSYADITVDESNFFGNGQPALSICFVEEDTHQATPEAATSDGWLVITSTQEKELYGVDAFYLNFYYSGDDADVFLRVIDDDNEYWHSQIKLANNAKQTVVVGFEDFVLRTQGGTTIANMKFDYDHIKGVELVFERSFGDGVCLISDLKAISKSKYKHLFLDEFDFSEFDTSKFVYENYEFAPSAEDSGSTLKLDYSDASKPRINGYGICKIEVNKLIPTGDALAVRIRSTSAGGQGINALIRVLEEDGDRWLYSQPIASLPEDGKLIIPFAAFTLSEARGDGARQFFYIKQLQLGIQGVYSLGSLWFSDMEIVTLSKKVDGLYRTEIAADGTIENFDGYKYSAQMYYVWQNSTVNKDEQMSTDKTYIYGGGNVAYGVFRYKSDMMPATYGVAFDGREGYSAVSFWVKDDSVKFDNAKYNHITSVCAKMTVYLIASDGKQYTHTIPALTNEWMRHTVLLTDFKTAAGAAAAELKSEDISGFMFDLQYYYYTAENKPAPAYASSNKVYLDNIKFTDDTSSSVSEIVLKLYPEKTDANLCIIDNFEGYGSAPVTDRWSFGLDNENNKIELKTESSGNHCLEMFYKGSDAVAYSISPVFDSSVVAKALRFKVFGDGKATIYVNIYLVHGGSTYKYRYTISRAAAGWNEYTIGFDNFNKESGNGNLAFNKDTFLEITSITWGVKDSSGGNTEQSVLLDDLCAVGNVSYGIEKIVEVQA